MIKVSKLEERKQLVLQAMHRLQRPVWIGDLAVRASDCELFRPAFAALSNEGRIVRKRRHGASRVYYDLPDAGELRVCAELLRDER